MNEIIKNSSDFLFIYEAKQCNPNGDPDQENKPRMDYETKTNLVSDTRVKRYIRDYLKNNGRDIFVDMENETKVSPDSKLKAVINKVLADEEEKKRLFSESNEFLEHFNSIVENKQNEITIFEELQSSKNKKLNNFILMQLVKEKYIDIRMFGSAFAVKEFKKPLTGPIQLNWGYSLNKVELMESNSIVTIMNDDESTFGKDYRVHYSLLAFNGTINKNAAKTTQLSEQDKDDFRNSIWNSITATPSRSKLNQYPKLYIELIYNEGYNNGYFGDLRDYVKAVPRDGIEEKQVRSFEDLILDLDKLKNLLKENKGDGKPLSDYYIKTANGIKLDAE